MIEPYTGYVKRVDGDTRSVRWGAKIDMVGGKPVVSMQVQDYGPFVQYEAYEEALEEIKRLQIKGDISKVDKRAKRDNIT